MVSKIIHKETHKEMIIPERDIALFCYPSCV